MEPKNLDALLSVLNLAPSKWTLAEQVERDRIEAEKRARRTKRNRGKGLRKWARKWPRIQAERKRKAFKARHVGKQARQVAQIERWAALGAMGRYRPLEQVKAIRRSIPAKLEPGRWYGRMELARVAGLDARFAERDITWAVEAGSLELRTVPRDTPTRHGHTVRREYRATGKVAEYVPDFRRRALYELQAYAYALNN